jgi:hypothetical protein
MALRILSCYGADADVSEAMPQAEEAMNRCLTALPHERGPWRIATTYTQTTYQEREAAYLHMITGGSITRWRLALRLKPVPPHKRLEPSCKQACL